MADAKQFLCPSCGALLNRERAELITLNARLRGPRFAVSFRVDVPAELGVYGAEWDPSVVLEEGCLVEFHCPGCGHDFTTSYSPEWAEVKMVEGEHEYVVVFSKTFGQHSTFLFDYSARRLVRTFGHATEDYVAQFGKNINFFGS